MSEDERLRLGAQQAALIQMQQQQDADMVEKARLQQQLMQQENMEKQRQQQQVQGQMEEQKLMAAQMAALAEKHQETETLSNKLRRMAGMATQVDTPRVMHDYSTGMPPGVTVQMPQAAVVHAPPQRPPQQPPMPVHMQRPQQIAQGPSERYHPLPAEPLPQPMPGPPQSMTMQVRPPPGRSINMQVRPPMEGPPGMGQVRIQAPTPLMQPGPPHGHAPGTAGQPSGPPVSIEAPMRPQMRPQMPSIQPLMSGPRPPPPVPSATRMDPHPGGPRGAPERASGPGPRGGTMGGEKYNSAPPPGVSRPAVSSSSMGPKLDSGPKLPAALERMLEFKNARAMQVGVKMEDIDKVEKGEKSEEADSGVDMEQPQQDSTAEQEEDDMEDEDEEETTTKEKRQEKNRRRKKKKKRARSHRQVNKLAAPVEDKPVDEAVEIEYIAEEPGISKTDPLYWQFAGIFANFKIEEPVDLEKQRAEREAERKKEELAAVKPKKKKDSDEDSDDDDKKDDDDKPKISKKKLKKLNRLSVAELKQLVTRPDVVEMHDVTAHDPKLLVHLKAARNSVPVPRHWCFKRKYLQGKRGIEKPPFDLPDFIKQTGIMEMRQALADKEESKSLKQKMRERVRPKMGKIDIDYKKLHDAFFRWQTKPKMTIHGDLYYEGKEFETRLREKKPGNLTDDLRTALGMPIGAGCDKVPPPWLIAMQRYGPPPSYPNLKIHGLNAAIPEGTSFGYHAGGWGKPPVDENGKPLYGDVFGTALDSAARDEKPDEDIDKAQWGELESESSEEEESEEESEGEEGDKEVDPAGLVTPGEGGLITPSGLTSVGGMSTVPVGMETPDMIELRKKNIEDAMERGGDTPALYQVLPEKKTTVGGAMMGSAHVYDLQAAAAGGRKAGGGTADGVDIALNPDELDLDTDQLQAKYDQIQKEQQLQVEKEDLSDMVAEHAAKQQKKRKKQAQEQGKAAKKYKEFKF